MGHQTPEKCAGPQHFIELQTKLANAPVVSFFPTLYKLAIDMVVGMSFPDDLVHEQWDGMLPESPCGSSGRHFLGGLISIRVLREMLVNDLIPLGKSVSVETMQPENEQIPVLDVTVSCELPF